MAQTPQEMNLIAAKILCQPPPQLSPRGTPFWPQRQSAAPKWIETEVVGAGGTAQAKQIDEYPHIEQETQEAENGALKPLRRLGDEIGTQGTAALSVRRLVTAHSASGHSGELLC